MLQDIGSPAQFDQPSGIHDADPICQKTGQSQVMRNKDLGNPVPVPQALQFFGHLQLDRGIQGAGRLVTEEDFLPQQQGQRQRRALVHAAAEGIGAFGQHAPPVGQLHLEEGLFGQLVKGRGIIASVAFERLRKLSAIAADRVEGRLGGLEDNAHSLTAYFAAILFRECGELRALQIDRAGEKPNLRRRQQGLEQRALAAAALPHEAENLPALQAEGDVRRRRAFAVADGEMGYRKNAAAHLATSTSR